MVKKSSAFVVGATGLCFFLFGLALSISCYLAANRKDIDPHRTTEIVVAVLSFFALYLVMYVTLLRYHRQRFNERPGLASPQPPTSPRGF
jgi:hypothetical protein